MLDCHAQIIAGASRNAGTVHKILFVPFFFSTSRFQGPAFSCDKIVVIVTLLAEMYRWLSWILIRHFEKRTRQMEGIQDKDYNFLGKNQSEQLWKLSLHQSLVKRSAINVPVNRAEFHCDRISKQWSNRTPAAPSFDFEITRMISDQTALHSVQLPL